jgi:hypothetical protein
MSVAANGTGEGRGIVVISRVATTDSLLMGEGVGIGGGPTGFTAPGATIGRTDTDVDDGTEVVVS